MTNKNNIVTAEKMKELAFEVGDIKEIITLTNDLIDFFPSVKESKVQKNALFFYGATQDSLGNIFGINQQVLGKLEDVANALYGLQDELEQGESNEVDDKESLDHLRNNC